MRLNLDRSHESLSWKLPMNQLLLPLTWCAAIRRGIFTSAILKHRGGAYSFFDRDGKFKRRFGKRGEGPGEHLGLTCFDITANRHVLLLSTTKLIKFDHDGKLAREIRLNFSSFDMAILKGLIYVHVGRYRYPGTERKAIHIFNGNLEKTGQLYTYDDRIEKLNFDVLKKLATDGEKLYYTKQYDLKLRIFDPASKEVSQLVVPNDNDRLDKIWSKKRLTEKDEDEISKILHRFEMIFPLDGKLFLMEDCSEKTIYDFWILDITGKKATVFPYAGAGSQVKKLLFWVRGSHKDTVIIPMKCSDKKDFEKFQEAFPPLREIDFNIDDNPVLLFFKFKDF